MTIFDNIRRRFSRAGAVLFDQRAGACFGAFDLTKYNFAELIWLNICDIIADLCEDVQLTDASGAGALTDEGMRFASFKAFFYNFGHVVMQRLFDEGYVVIGWDGVRFWTMDSREYSTPSENDKTVVKPHNPYVDVYVMKSPTFMTRGRSDRSMCIGFLSFLDDVLNSSATISRKMGAVVIASPKNLTSSPTPLVLTEETKKKMEKEMQEDYGAMNGQSKIMLMPREMAFQVVNLAGLELKMQEKIRTSILAIADRLKVPCNQVAIIDATSSKQLANGSELREGDRLKYKTFRRLFERTFADMARHYRLQIAYAIDGEPIGKDDEVSV